MMNVLGCVDEKAAYELIDPDLENALYEYTISDHYQYLIIDENGQLLSDHFKDLDELSYAEEEILQGIAEKHPQEYKDIIAEFNELYPDNELEAENIGFDPADD